MIYGFSKDDAQRIRKTVLNDEREKNIAPWRHAPLADGAEEEPYNGPFAVTLAKQGDTVRVQVNGGFVNANGALVGAVAPAELAFAPGYLCVHIEISDAGEWSTPVFTIKTSITANDYPVALLEETDGGKRVSAQARVFVAIFLISRLCPLAEF